jgi:hypothetical protein
VDWEPGGGVATTAIALGGGVDDTTYLSALRDALPPVVDAHRPTFVIYVAGTDPAADDRLGDWRISPQAMLERDQFVVDQVRRIDPTVPLVVVISGGYGREAWRYTARFAGWLARGTVVEPPDDFALVLRQARPAQLPRETGADWGLTEADLGGIVPGAAAPARVFGVYSPHAVELSLEQTGLLAAVRARGFHDPVVTVDAGAALGDTIRLFGDGERRELLMELRVSRSKRVVPGMEVLYVEWLRLQNPRAAFSRATTPLPGQQHPGLGLLREVVAWLVRATEALGLDGLAAQPAQYFMAAVTHRHMRFLDPGDRARFDALHAVLAGMPLSQAEAVLSSGRVVDTATGEAVRWQPSLQLYPVRERLRREIDRRHEGQTAQPSFMLMASANG